MTKNRDAIEEINEQIKILENNTIQGEVHNLENVESEKIDNFEKTKVFNIEVSENPITKVGIETPNNKNTMKLVIMILTLSILILIGIVCLFLIKNIN